MESQLPHGTETVLLVEDEDPVRTVATRMLERLGYKVLQAADPDQALHLANLSNAHLLIMDVVLPGVSGLALAHKICTIRPGIRVLYMSAYASEQVLDDRVESRTAVGFIQKPFTSEELSLAVRKILDQHISPTHDGEPMPRGTESVLVVDDDPQVRRFMVRCLDRLGYHTLEAQFADRALTIATNARVDLVVMDVVLSDASGFGLARSIHAVKPQVQILFVSGKAPEELVELEHPGEGKPHFLKKPFSAEELGRAARRALDAPMDSKSPGDQAS